MHTGEKEKDILEGAMLKRGGFFSGWKERLFVLTNKRLQYYCDSSRSSATKGDIPLSDIKSVDSLPEKKHGKRFCLAISTPQDTWVVRAETETDFNRWRDAIRNAIAGERHRPSQPPGQDSPATESGMSRSRMQSTVSAITDQPEQRSEKRSKEKAQVQAAVEDNYSFGRVIDIGSNGKVLEGKDKRTGDRVAIKQIDVGAGIEDEGQLEIWQQVQHENVVRLLDFYKTPSQLFFVMELAMGKDLFYGVMQHYHHDKPRGFSERDAMELTSQLMSALRHLHLRRIVHCDLKPENILLHEENGRMKIKLADWGYAQVLSSGRPLERVLGTGSYMAPEILATQPYSEKVDVWSAGVIFFVLLCGFPPYEAMYDDEVLDLAATLDLVRKQCSRGSWGYFPSPYWDRVSREGRHFIQSLLTLDPAKRPSAEQTLKHPWYAKFSNASKTTPRTTGDNPLSGMLEQMGQYNASRARNVIEHCLGGVLQHTRSGAAMAAAAVVGEEEEQGHILAEEGWQPLISLAWSSNSADRKIAAMALANVTQSKAQAQRLVREGGLRVLLQALLGAQGGREEGEEETQHYASMALANLANFEGTREALMKQQAHRQLIAINRRAATACRYQAGRALARLCRDDRWQEELVAAGALEAVLELATQALFESMQEEAVRALQALGRNQTLTSTVVGELRKELQGGWSKGRDRLWALLEELEGKAPRAQDDTLNSLTFSENSDKGQFSGNDLHTPKISASEAVGLAGGLEALEEVQPELCLHGSSGTVRRMRVTATQHLVAVKFVPLEVVEGERRALLAEISANYSCGEGGPDVPVEHNMIGFHGAFYEAQRRRLGIVMEWVTGGNLLELYRTHKGPLPEEAIRSVGQQAAAALHFMHSRHLIHRDVKPSSLLVDVEGRVKVTNLGNLRRLAKTTGQAASVVGTTCYFAPERIVGVAFSNSVDVWGFGLTVLEAAIREFPFKGYQHNYMALLEHIVDCECPVNQAGKQLSAPLRALLVRCLQKQARDRPTFSDLLQDPFLRSSSPEASRAVLRAAALTCFAAASATGKRSE